MMGIIFCHSVITHQVAIVKLTCSYRKNVFRANFRLIICNQNQHVNLPLLISALLKAHHNMFQLAFMTGRLRVCMNSQLPLEINSCHRRHQRQCRHRNTPARIVARI